MASVKILNPGDGKNVLFLGNEMVLKVVSTDTGGVFSLCWEANVVSMVSGSTSSNVFGSLSGVRSTLTVPYAEGWLNMGFAQARVAPAASTVRLNISTFALTPGLTTTYTGLPVVGFAGISLVNTGTLPNTNYGGVYSHSYLRNIAP